MRDLVIVGGGNMGYAFAKRLLQINKTDLRKLKIIEKNLKRRDFLTEDLKCPVLSEISFNIENSLVLLAIKPQDRESMLLELSKALKANNTVVSIMGGVSLDELKSSLNIETIIRSMPNLPSIVGKGMTVYTGGVSKDDFCVKEAAELFDCIGESLWVEKEDLIDSATAISGSGPAIVALFIQWTQDVAMDLGFTEEQSKQLAYATFSGTTEYLNSTGIDAKTMVDRVTSPNGTTAAARSVLYEAGVKEKIINAFKAAANRARELGKR